MFLDMPLEEAMRSQRAIRRLKPDPVDDELLLHLLDLAIRAPSGSNQQKWQFILVKDRTSVAEIGRINSAPLGLYKKFASRKSPSGTQKRMMDAVVWQQEHFHETPVVVVACMQGVFLPLPLVAVASFFGSIFPAVQNLLLAARAAGLGAALITIPLWNSGRLKRVLGLPWNVVPCALVPMGWPLDKYGPNRRQPVEEKVHLDRFGHQPFLSRGPSEPR